MGEIVAFPSFDERVWRRLEADGANLLLGFGFSEASAKLVLADWKARVLAAVRSFELPVHGQEYVLDPQMCQHLDRILKPAEIQVQRLTENLIAQLFVTVCELWAIKLGDEAPVRLRDRIQVGVNSFNFLWTS
jgi:hypothetical protein